MSGTTLVLQVQGQVRGTLPWDEGAGFGTLCQQVKKELKLSSDVAALEVQYAQGTSELVTSDESLSKVMGMVQENFVVVQVICGAVSPKEDMNDTFVFVKMKKALDGDDFGENDDSDSDSDDDEEEDDENDDEDEEEEDENHDENVAGTKAGRKAFISQGVEQFKACFPSEQDCLSFLVLARVKRCKAKKFGLELSKNVAKMSSSVALEREDIILASFVEGQVPLGLVLKKIGFKPKKLKKAGLVRLAHVFFQWRGHKKCGKRDHHRGHHGGHHRHHDHPHHHHHGPPHPHHHHGPPQHHHHHHGPPHHHHHHHGPPHDHHHHGPPHHHHHHGPPHHHHGPPPHLHHLRRHHGRNASWRAPKDVPSGSSSSSSSDSSDEDMNPIPFAEFAHSNGPYYGEPAFHGPPPFAMQAGGPWSHGPPPFAGRGRGGMRRRMRMMRGHHGPRGRRGRANRIGGSNKRLARLVRHKTIADGTVLKTKSTFSKTWVIRNDSDKQWPASAQLTCIGGDSMETKETMSQLVGPLKPGQEIEVSIASLQVPSLAGLYKSFYRFESTDGQRFGQRLWCSVMAEE